MKQKIRSSGRFKIICRNADGSVAWKELVSNGVCTAGLNYLLDAGFRGQTPITTWYIGLITASGFSAVSTDDTASSHAGWTENTSYSQSVRVTWTPRAASGGAITNPARATFSINAATTIRGAFLISNSTKGGTTGTIWATGILSADRALLSGQAIDIEYETTLVGGG